MPSTPFFPLHGAADPIVPVSDALPLAARLEQHGARVRLLVTDAFSRVDAGEDISFFSAWPLLRFVAAFLCAAGV